MNIKFKVFIKSENRYVYPFGFIINQYDNKIIRLYFNDNPAECIYGIPYHENDIVIENNNIVFIQMKNE